MIDPQKTIDRNLAFGNKQQFDTGKYDWYLDYSMMREEIREFLLASDSDDKVEMVDACIDVIFVALWTLHKLWLDAESITRAYDEVCRSNDSKIGAKKRDGKVTKGENYSPPNLNFVL